MACSRDSSLPSRATTSSGPDGNPKPAWYTAISTRLGRSLAFTFPALCRFAVLSIESALILFVSLQFCREILVGSGALFLIVTSLVVAEALCSAISRRTTGDSWKKNIPSPNGDGDCRDMSGEDTIFFPDFTVRVKYVSPGEAGRGSTDTSYQKISTEASSEFAGKFSVFNN